MHLLLKVPERRSVPDDDFARRVAALYGPDRAAVLFARWEKWREEGREADATRERDGLLRRMFDLGQFMKTVKEIFHIRYCRAHGWEGTLWRGRYKSLLVCESFAAFKALSLYIALNPVRAGIAKRGTDSKWTSYGQARRGGGFGAECHGALLRELARLAGSTRLSQVCPFPSPCGIKKPGSRDRPWRGPRICVMDAQWTFVSLTKTPNDHH